MGKTELTEITKPAYRPPAPIPRKIDLRATRTTARGLWNYFTIMTTNPLEIWCEDHFNETLFPQKVLGRRFLFVHDPALIRHYMVTNAANYGLTFIRKAMFEPILGQGLFVAEGDDWRSTRRALTPVFTPRHVGDLAGIMQDVARARVAELGKRQGGFSLSEEMLRLTLDILLATLFSKSAKLDTERFSTHIDRLLEIAGAPHPMDLVQLPRFIPRYGRGEARMLIGEIRAYMQALVTARREALASLPADQNKYHSDSGDILSLLLTAKGAGGRALSDSEVIDNLLTFLAAGHETTARSMMWLFYILTQQPALYEHLREEVAKAALDTTRPSDWAGHLPLAVATLKEAMRLYPAAGILNRVALGPDKIGDIEVTKGTELITAPWLLHRHRALWEAPDIFDPARFLGAAAKLIPKGAYIPYGIGPRICIGASFAQQEMIIILVAFLRGGKLKFVDDQHPEPVLRITIQPSTPLMMRFAGEEI